MGAYLYFKVEDESNAELANELVEQTPEHELLTEMDDRIQRVYFHLEDYYPGVGAGSIKTSSLPPEHTSEAIEAYTAIFEKLHASDEIEIKVLSNSCSLRISTFSFEQLQRLTDNGDAISGDEKEAYRRMLEKREAVGSFPSGFTKTFTREDETVLETPPNTDLIELQGIELNQMGDLLRDKRRVIVLDVLLTLFTGRVPGDVFAEQTPLTEDTAEKAFNELNQWNLVKYGGINQESEYFEELMRLHDATTLEEPTVKNVR